MDFNIYINIGICCDFCWVGAEITTDFCGHRSDPVKAIPVSCVTLFDGLIPLNQNMLNGKQKFCI